jgi:hypothetical protein
MELEDLMAFGDEVGVGMNMVRNITEARTRLLNDASWRS